MAGLDGVRRSEVDGLVQWRVRGRLVARQLDESLVVLRSAFSDRDGLVRRYPATFSVTPRFAKHMMVVVDLRRGDDDAIEDAMVAAWELQRRGR